MLILMTKETKKHNLNDGKNEVGGAVNNLPT